MSSPDARAPHSAGPLSPEALSALGLRRQPFTELAADGDLYTDDTTAEQLADIRQALITGDDLLLILGPHGAGKSTLLAQLAANSGQRIQCFSVHGSPRFSTQNLFAGVLEAFRERPPEELREVLDALVPHLQRMAGDNVLCTVVLDDADRVAEPELTQLLSGMLYLNSRDETLLRIALAAEEEFEARIPELLPEGADLPYSGLVVEPFGAERAAGYLDFRLNQAGRFDAFPFSDRDVEAMNARAGGRPSALHVEATRELEARHGDGAVDDLPPELAEPRRRGSRRGSGSAPGVVARLRSVLDAREGKLALGALALALILGGLLLTRTPPEPEDAEARYRVVETGPVAAAEAPADADEESRLTLVRELSEARRNGDAAGEADGATDDAVAATESAPGTPADADGADPRGERLATEPLAASSRPEPVPAEPAPAASERAATSPDVTSRDAAPVGGGAGGEADRTVAAASGSEPAPGAEPGTEPGTGPASAPVAERPPEPAAPDVPDVEVALAEPEGAPPAAPEPDPAPAAALPAARDAAAEPLDGLESPNWVLVQDPDRFTVQMSASTERASVESFLARTGLEAPNSIFTFDRDGTTWFALVHGLYDSIEEARLAIERMPPAAQTNQPWIRGVGRIQAALKAEN